MNYYKGIKYFKLAKPSFGYPIGTQVNIGIADGRECLWIGGQHTTPGGIDLHIDFAKDHPDWFIPVTDEEHATICKESTIRFIISETNCNRDKAVKVYNDMCKFHQLI